MNAVDPYEEAELSGLLLCCQCFIDAPPLSIRGMDSYSHGTTIHPPSSTEGTTMKFLPGSVSRMSLLAAVALAAGPSRAGLDAASGAFLDHLRHSPESAGSLVYHGAVYRQGAVAGRALFNYERRVQLSATELTAAHITRDPAGEVIIAETARVGPGYSVKRFDAVNRQLGYRGTVSVADDGRELRYLVTRNGATSTATETVDLPVVTGPSLHGFILHRWNTLARGEKLSVRMVVLAKKETYGFDIARVREEGGRTTFSITPSALLIRLAVAPLHVTFDTRTRQVMQYEGRVPPMQVVAAKLKNLDARVAYTSVAESYR